MQRKLAALVVALLTAACLFVAQPAQAQTKVSNRDAKNIAAVRAVLDAQAAAWNRGDIEGYMDGYARSDETTFIGGDTLTRGWSVVLDRYKKGYDTRDKMGQLTFSDLEIKPLDKETALAFGRWKLTRIGDTPHGRFSLVFRRTHAGWRIIHDHTSSG